MPVMRTVVKRKASSLYFSARKRHHRMNCQIKSGNDELKNTQGVPARMSAYYKPFFRA
jgi:hypothetical protein